MPVPTYDEKQRNAVLTVCTVCGRAFYMTQPQPVCMACREAAR